MMHSDDIVLRALEPEDLELVFQIENDPSLWQYGSNKAPVSRYSIRQYLSNATNDIYRDGELRLVICHNDKPVGFIDLTDMDSINSRAQVGVVVVPDAQQQGVGKRAIAMVEEYAAQVLHIHSLYAVVSEANTSASRAFLSAGFMQVSTLPHWVMNSEGRFEDALLFQYICD